MTNYRLDRPFAMMLAGACAVVAAAGVFVAFLLVQFDGWAYVVGVASGVVAVLAVAAGLRLWFRSPVVLRLDAHGFRGRGRSPGGRFVGRWLDVQDVAVRSELISVDLGGQHPVVLPLDVIEATRRDELIREIYDRLNKAHGYRRFDPS